MAGTIRSVDIVAVANAAGVSTSTVSRCFNHPQQVRPSTRRRVETAVQQLGYIRNRAAQAMHGRRSGTVGLIVPTVNHTIFSELIQSFSEAIGEAGLTLLIAAHGFDLEREYAVLRTFLEHRVDGVAMIGLDHLEATYRIIEQRSIPAIAVWNYDAASRLSCIGADNEAAGRLAVSHLLSLGHRRIALVFPPTAQNDRARGRLRGVHAALEAAGVRIAARWKAEAPYSIAQAKRICIDLLSDDARPRAILCGNDVIAQGAAFAAARLGLRIPDDLSIIGMGDFAGSEEMEPALTTIRIPARRIGAQAGQRLATMINDDEPPPAIRRERFEPKLMTRATTARAGDR